MYRPRKPFIRGFQRDVRVRSRGYLPHWETPGGVYFITFRLADALPAAVVEDLRRKREEMEKRAAEQGRLSWIERQEISRLFCLRTDRYLDAGMGRCELRDPRAARIVVDSLRYFDSERYRLKKLCAMPNHVHVIVRPFEGWTLSSILHSWKSYTAHEINRALGRRGRLWQEESFDHLIRDDRELATLSDYVLSNPAQAGLVEWPWVWSED